jgi:peptide/nickel transport system substrate-binding protein
MLSSKRIWAFLSLLIVATMLLAACGGAPAAQTPAATSAAAPAAATAAPAAPAATAAAPAAATAAAPDAAPTAAAATSGAANGTLTVALTTNPNSLDMPATAEINAAMTAWQMYDSLVWVDDTGKIMPALAESWDISADGTEYTFKLRPGVTFHNGEPFTADSVIVSWQRGSRPEMQFGDRWTIAKSVEKVDDLTVKIKTEKPNPLLLRTIASNWAMVPAKYTAEVGDAGFNAKPVGTGPFEFVEWIKEDRIVMKANPNYWQAGLPKVEQLIFRPIPESATRVAAIQTGEADVVARLSAEEAGTLEGKANLQLVRYPVDRVYYITFNNLTSGKGKPTEDARVRQAMNYAVDREAIVESLFKGAAKLSTGFVTPTNLGYNAAIKPYAYDPDKAKALLTEAGFPDGFEMAFACPSGAYTNFEQVCEAVKGYLEAVNIKTDLEFMESGKYWDLEGKKELPPLFGDSWSEASGEAFPRLRGALAGQDAAFSAWSDPKIDELLGKISTTIDDKARGDLYSQLHQYMYDNPPFIYLYEPETFEAISTRVQNYKPRANEMKYFMGVSVAGQ